MNDIKDYYFMRNTDWYSVDEENEMFVLTPQAPEKAIESYEQYLKDLEEEKKEGYLT